MDALGRRTGFEMNDHGDVVRITDPDGAQTSAEYNDLHQVVAAHMPDGSVWRCEYDERGNPVRLIDATGVATRHRYAPNGAVIEVMDVLDSSIHYACDAAGLHVEVTDSLDATTRAERDAFGRIVSVTDPLGARSHFEWSVEGQLVRHVQPDGTQRTWSHDAEGNITDVVEPAGGLSRFEFGPLGRMTSRTGPDGARFTFEYDTALNLRSVNHPAGATWTYSYDAAGRLTGETDFIECSQQYEYDPAGGVVAVTNRLGQQTTFERDAMGRVVQGTSPEGDYTYSYDLAGRLVAAAGPGSSIEFCRDAVGRVVQETVDGRSVHFEYDVAGRRTRRITPSGAVSEWMYDATGRPAALAAGAGGMRFEFDAAGREVARQLGADAWLAREVDPLGRVTNERLWVGERRPERAADTATASEPRLVLNRSWMWSTDGLPITVHDNMAGSRRFATDNIGRVTAVTAEGWNETYAYDGFGNLSTGTTGGDAMDAEAHRTLIRRIGRTAFDHDAAGRVVRATRRTLDGRRRTWTYQWDNNDRLAQVETPDGTVWRYSYDPLGRRTNKARVETNGGVTEQVAFTWDGPRIAEQHTIRPDVQNAVVVWDYDPSTARPLAQRHQSPSMSGDSGSSDDVFYAIITDTVGTPTELVTLEGRVAWRTTAGLWGRTMAVTADPGVDCPLRFPGRYFDSESGLHYNFHRYYDPDSAAFLTPDPLGLAPAPNDHSYVSNPLVHTDPLGLMCPQAAGSNTPQPPESNVVELPEVTDPKPRKPAAAMQEWEDFLGPGPYSNIHPRTGMPDPDRLVSADGTRSIRMGNHEMGSKPTKFHFHKETWDWIAPSNTWVVGNTMVRVPLGVK